MLGAAMLVTLFEKRKWSGFAAGLLLGVAVLGQGFRAAGVVRAGVPDRPRQADRDRGRVHRGGSPVACFLLFAQRASFWDEYFWRQQFSRFFTPERQHVHGWWYYVPVLLAGLFPWTPLVTVLARKATYEDVRMRFLGAWLVYGFVFFSASQNKLAGYLLPLMPGLAVLLAVGLDQLVEKTKIAPWLLASSAALLVILPTVVLALPQAMLAGVGRTHINVALGLPFLLIAVPVWLLSRSGKPSLAILAAGMGVVFGVAYFKGAAFPELDDRVSVRGFWREHHAEAAMACVENVGRTWEYGLNYYAERPFHACSPGESPRIAVVDGRLTVVR